MVSGVLRGEFEGDFAWGVRQRYPVTDDISVSAVMCDITLQHAKVSRLWFESDALDRWIGSERNRIHSDVCADIEEQTTAP
jgi:hypothetical protein